MPTYEYECKKCKHKFEKFLSINHSDGIKCPLCGSETKKIIFGGAGLIFKGNGFYITDYKKNHTSPGTPDKPKSDKSETKKDND